MYEFVLIMILAIIFLKEVARRLFKGKTIFLSDDDILIILTLLIVIPILVVKKIIA